MRGIARIDWLRCKHVCRASSASRSSPQHSGVAANLRPPPYWGSMSDMGATGVVDWRGIDLNLLVSLDVLLEECNVTRAAERLHLSQPALSAQLSRLRQTLDDPLLLPADSGRGMIPTARALALAAPLRAVLRDLEMLVTRRVGFDPVQAERTFRIAASDNAVATLGLTAIEALPRAAGRGVRLAFLRPDTARAAEQLERGEIDLLVGSERALPGTMKARKLVEEHFVVAQRKGHPRGRHPPSLDEYCALRHVLVSTSGGSLHGFMDEHLERLGRRRDVVLSVQHFTLVPAILQATDYVSTLPSRLAARFTEVLDAYPLPFEALGFALHAAWHPRHHQDPASIWLREFLAECARSGAANT